MNATDFRETLNAARQELAEKLRQREEIETRIAQLKRIIAGVADYVDESLETEKLFGIKETSLKNAIRTAMRALGPPATATDVRRMLKELHYEAIEEHNNPSASIVNVLKRLIADGEVAYGPERDGRKTYVWVMPVYGAPNSLANIMEDQRRDTERKRKK